MNFGEIFLWELLGTAALTLLGCGVVANVVLKRTLGTAGGWLLINIGWGIAVLVGASIANPSGAHINPAVTLGLLAKGDSPFGWGMAPAYLLGQMVGAFLGAVLCWAAYKLQFDTHDEPANTRGIFSTGPTVPNYGWNLATEIIGTFVLVFWIVLNPSTNLALGYAAVALVVIGIGASLGGPTGYAINPARDLGPRIAYAVLPITGKGSPDWNYSWVPVVGPIVGGVLAGLVYQLLPSAT
ncbi:MAG TPA: MIP/aquaporin family protein [Actinophytocola sp.]|uniref:MIP/aquaporin family protein n=1 Tax=Actinophytocola sp. TaxID=1872138 RepID=UPI002DDD85D7|nr:MIP/aquaporin family protein [Actinophytocola sp.]HEV2783097.1 MIP/aquaporin family protein [Actinophytocola sp.]